MSYRLVIRPEAHAEVTAAAHWYEDEGPGLGREFLNSFRAAIGLLRTNPLLYQPVVGQIRRVLLRRFPYSVFYEATEQEIVVLACFHQARDPETWVGTIGSRASR